MKVLESLASGYRSSTRFGLVSRRFRQLCLQLHPPPRPRVSQTRSVAEVRVGEFLAYVQRELGPDRHPLRFDQASDLPAVINVGSHRWYLPRVLGGEVCVPVLLPSSRTDVNPAFSRFRRGPRRSKVHRGFRVQ
jgi:hypothetical protein